MKKMSEDYVNNKKPKTCISQNKNLTAAILVIHGDTTESCQMRPSPFILVSAMPPFILMKAMAMKTKKREDEANKSGYAMAIVGSNGILPAANLILIGDTMESSTPAPSTVLLFSAVPPFNFVSTV